MMKASCKKRSTDFTDKSVLAVFRVQEDIATEAKEKARREDLSFSQLMRRAIRRELNTAA
ncbi:MAG: ribbon-helix-helix protein, CopG family [Verrucomicrobiota bacterium]